MTKKEKIQEFSAGILLYVCALGLLACAFARGYQEFKKDKPNDKIIQKIKSSLMRTH